jgi:hypothetical protein
MAQTGFTPIQLYYSSTTTNVPLAANLANGELAINITDGKLFYKDNAAAVQVIGWKTVPTSAGGTGLTSYTAGDTLYYASGTTLTKLAIGTAYQAFQVNAGATAPSWQPSATSVLTAQGDLLYASGANTLARLAKDATATRYLSNTGTSNNPAWAQINLANGVTGTLPTSNGGTGQTSNLTQYGVVYGSTTTAMATTAAGTSTQVLHGNASGAPTWSAVSLTADVSGTLPVANGGTNLTSFTANGLVYASSTSALTTNAGLTFNGTDFAVGANNDNTARTFTVYNNAGAEGTFFNAFYRSNGGSYSLSCYNANNGGWNAADAAVKIGTNSATSRSINAGGTINAAGLDYAEYMTKAGDFTIAKGDVVGIDAQGKLTNVFANAISFVVKSTNPSYVGGDNWGSAKTLGLTDPIQPLQPNKNLSMSESDWAAVQATYQTELIAYNDLVAALETATEAARINVDRIAFAGQVPVNVTGATAGQYIIPINDNGAIKGAAISNPTFEQYQIAVGKVIAIEPDGRAKIIVKVI